MRKSITQAWTDPACTPTNVHQQISIYEHEPGYQRLSEGARLRLPHIQVSCGQQTAELPSPPWGLCSSNLPHRGISEFFFPFFKPCHSAVACVTPPPPPTSTTPSEKLGVHSFHWLVCWQTERLLLWPWVTWAGSTCVCLDQQVAGKLSDVIVKPLFIHSSYLCAQNWVSRGLFVNNQKKQKDYSLFYMMWCIQNYLWVYGYSLWVSSLKMWGH